MIPISLRIKGLYSFQEEQKIDFTKLVSAQVFGIFGTVGSGKSTILEAISFALFNSTERMNSRENRNYNMMNLKSDELLIDFEFRNYDGQVYRFTVKGKRHNTDFSKVNSFQRDAYHWKDGSWIPLGNITGEEILGLSYENFRRTIIIPQGQFQEFLELGDKDRTNMLKELFHLGKYDFFYQTVSLEKKNNEQIQYLSGQLAQFEHTTQENITQKSEEVQAISDELAVLRNALEEAKAQEKIQSELKKLFAELKSRQEILAVLVGHEPQIIEKEHQLGRYESCVQLFKSQLSAKNETETKLKEKDQALKETTKELQHLIISLQADQQQFEVVEPAFKQLDQKRQEIADYKQLVLIRKLREEIAALQSRLSVGEAKLETEAASRKAVSEQVDSIKKQIQEVKSKLPDQTELAEVKAWFVQQNAIRKNISNIGEEKAGFEKLLLEKQRSISIPEALTAEIPFDAAEKTESYIERLEAQKRLNDTKSEAIAGLNNHLLLQEKLEEFTQELQDGKPCPLCGSVHHPEIMSVENVKETRELNDSKLENVRKQNVLMDQVIRYLREHVSAQKALEMQVEVSGQRIHKEELLLKTHVSGFRWKNFSPEDEKAFDAAFEMSKSIALRISELEKQHETKEKELKNAEQNLEKFNKLLQEIRDEFNLKTAERKTIEEQLKTIGISNISMESEALTQHIITLEKHVSETAEKHELLSKKIIAQNQKKSVLDERIQSTQVSLKEYKDQLEKLEADLLANLDKSSFSHVDEIVELLKQEIDTKALREEIDHFRQAFFKSKADVAEMEKQTEGKTFDLNIYDILIQQIAVQEKTVQEKHDAHVRENAMLQKLKEDFAQKEMLMQSMDTFRRRADNISIMKNLFKGSGFVNYISTVYLNNLCEMANVRFYKLTRQQLRLEIGDSNEFLVRDYLNDGKLRSAKTLSGGQMFQAALSLALALAESIQQQTKAKQNFFFLDEGFGSQDKISLQVVFESLKSLREEHRVIGVISHVEELQQEIDMYLKLENDPEFGSRVEESWN